MALVRNDPKQYDALADIWWDESGPFAMLHWIAAARARLVPQASSPTAVLIDLACGAGLLAPHIEAKGYRHIGIDLNALAIAQASEHGVTGVRGDVLQLPIADACADVVCAGEIFEHVTDLPRAIAESCRILKPGGLLVLDTIADTAIARFLAISVAEHIHGGAPPGIHDSKLFVNRNQLVGEYALHGVDLELRGLRPSVRDVIAWRTKRRATARMLPTRLTSVLFQGWGTKQSQ